MRLSRRLEDVGNTLSGQRLCIHASSCWVLSLTCVPSPSVQIEIADLAAYTLLPYIVQGGLGLLSGVIAGEDLNLE
jgi:hypothetical protein